MDDKEIRLRVVESVLKNGSQRDRQEPLKQAEMLFEWIKGSPDTSTAARKQPTKNTKPDTRKARSSSQSAT